MERPKRYIASVDPGTGTKSPLGFSVFEIESLEIIVAEELWPDNRKGSIKDRISSIAEKFRAKCSPYFLQETLFLSEDFVMRGKGGQTLQNMIGAIMGSIPVGLRFEMINTKVVKQMVTGTGAADKLQVAEGVLNFFKQNKLSSALIKQLTLDEKWDILDSLAIGIAGLRTYAIKPESTRLNQKNISKR